MALKQNSSKPNEVFIVAGDTQTAFPTGALFSTSNAVNLTDGYISAISVDPYSLVRTNGNHLQNTDTYPAVRKIKVVQGTPASANITQISAFNYGNPAVVASDIIEGDKIRSVAAKLPNYGKRNALMVSSIAAVEDETLYSLSLVIRGSRKQRDYGQLLDDREYASFTTPNYTTLGYTATEAKSHMLHNLLTNLAFYSREYRDMNTGYRGNKEFIVFGVNLAGGGGITGQAVGSIANGTSFNWLKINGATQAYTADYAFVQTIGDAIANSVLTTSSEIVPLDVTAPITSTNIIDTFLVVALDEQKAIAFSDIPTKRVVLTLNVGDGFRTTLPTLEEASRRVEALNTGEWLYTQWRNNAMLRPFTAQNYPLIGYYVEPPYYFSKEATALYTVTTIRFYGQTDMPNSSQAYEKSVSMLFPATATNSTDDAGTILGTGYTYATTNSTLVADCETILGDWIESTNSTNQYIPVGSATLALCFV